MGTKLTAAHGCDLPNTFRQGMLGSGIGASMETNKIRSFNWNSLPPDRPHRNPQYVFMIPKDLTT